MKIYPQIKCLDYLLTHGIDVEELLKVCNSHPRVHLLKPGPGVGGPCLPKDPYLLLRDARVCAVYRSAGG